MDSFDVDIIEKDNVRPLFEPGVSRGSCGVGFIVNIHRRESNQLLKEAIKMADRVEHRGATGGDNATGDGAGVLTSIPHSFYIKALKREFEKIPSNTSLTSKREVTKEEEKPDYNGVQLPPKGQYATGIIFLDQKFRKSQKFFETIAEELKFKVIHWRPVPRNSLVVGEVARKKEPYMAQVFLTWENKSLSQEMVANNLFVLRRLATKRIHGEERFRFYICSLSTDVIVYKGQFTSSQLWQYFDDLSEDDFECYMAVVHTRFSTNTTPSWERAHPNRYLAHNGEINTLRGNVNWMSAREGVMRSEVFDDDLLNELYPVIEPNMSDSGSLDNVLEFLIMAGKRSLPEAIMTLVPEAWQNDLHMPAEKKHFYQWASCVMEPWDGPSLFVFADGRYVGAILDRNGLRPSRYCHTADGHVVMASEVGVVDFPSKEVIAQGRLMPGRMLLIDTKMQVFARDEEVKLEIARERPLKTWVQELFTLRDLRREHTRTNIASDDSFQRKSVPIEGFDERAKNKLTPIRRGKLLEDRRLAMFSYTTETINMLILPMVNTKKEALGSMGNDEPLACLSLYQPLVYNYFKQLFAQVTNPPIDPFRESIVMSLACPIGPEANILIPSAQQCHRLWLEQPIININDLEVIINTRYKGWKTKVIDCTYPVEEGRPGYLRRLEAIPAEAIKAISKGNTVVVLSDRKAGSRRLPISMALALGATHQDLIKVNKRMSVALVVETGEAREVHHICVLLGYGADAICPYLVFETVAGLREEGLINLSDLVAYKNYIGAMERGILKVMAKMGISTLQSYKGAQIFEAVGLDSNIVERCFAGTASRIGGVTINVLAEEALQRHAFAFNKTYVTDQWILRNPGHYHWRLSGERHINDPQAIAYLQEAVTSNGKEAYRQFVRLANQAVSDCTLRGQLAFNYATKQVPIDEVEAAELIVRRFVTGAMSFGSISMEAHTTLAIAMNRIGGKSNTGEGGEDEERWVAKDPNLNRRSAIKQVLNFVYFKLSN